MNSTLCYGMKPSGYADYGAATQRRMLLYTASVSRWSCRTVVYLDRGCERGSGVFFKRSLKLCKISRETGPQCVGMVRGRDDVWHWTICERVLNFFSEGLSEAKGARKVSARER